jgi:hypothetical protein
MAAMLVGLAATVTAVWLPAPSLALFILRRRHHGRR